MRLSAAHETALLPQLEDVLPMKQQSASMSKPSPPRLFHPQRSLLLTLLFLPAVGLHRFWELRSYTGGELAVLTGRSQPYSYRHTERFLLQLSAAQADQALTQAQASVASLRVAGGGKESRGILRLFLCGRAEPPGLHRDLDSARVNWTARQDCRRPSTDVAA